MARGRGEVTPAAPGAAITFSDAVRGAREAGRPIVGLESSVLAQGLPAPANRDAEARMRRAIEERGAAAAVTAVVRGALTVGLDGDALERFLRRDGVTKVSARDLPVAITQRLDGATTVAGALACCVAAGIDVLATGGIGGVHRESPFDESADLGELARSSLVVVCAGAKAILDLPATLERIESLGISLVGYRTDELPGFFTAHTGLRLPARVETPAEVADLLRSARALGRPGSVLVVQPPPAAEALTADTVERAVTEALARAKATGVRGAAVSPFLLEAVERSTGGRSLRVNLALLEANAGLAAEVAVALSRPP